PALSPTHHTPPPHLPSVVSCIPPPPLSCFFFNAPASTQLYTLSLHDALPISLAPAAAWLTQTWFIWMGFYDFALSLACYSALVLDRKSTRLNSSHQIISYAVFCLKKKIKIRVDQDERTIHIDSCDPHHHPIRT